MEFREYWRIVWRRRNLLVPLLVVTFIASLLYNVLLPPVYKTDTTVYLGTVLPALPAGTNPYYSQEYYQTVYSEYIADDLSVIVKSEDFATKVADRIQARYGDKIGVKQILDSIIKTQKTHRTLKITVASGSEQTTRRIATAVDDVLRTDAVQYFAHNGQAEVTINLVDPARDPTAPSVVRRLLDVLLHTAVALVVGVGLAFLLHYLDDRVQDEEDAARTLGLPVLGALPAESPNGRGLTGTAAPALIAPWRSKTPA